MGNLLPTDLNELAKTIYQQNVSVGWWDDPNRCILTTVQLISTEIAEATEGERKNLMDDHLPHRKMAEVELADALIRTLDIGGKFNLVIPLDRVMTEIPRQLYLGEGRSAAVWHFWINTRVSMLGIRYATHLTHGFDLNILTEYIDLLAVIIATAHHLGYDLFGAVNEKLAYNKTRQDHKREARAQADGKKF